MSIHTYRAKFQMKVFSCNLISQSKLKTVRPIFSFCLLLFVFYFSFVNAQDNTAYFSVEGDLPKPLKLSFKELSELEPFEVKAIDKGGHEHTYKGVALWRVLTIAGASLGNELRGNHLKKYILVTARDGYKVNFSLPEIDPEFSNKIILLAYEMDGKPFVEAEGPFRLIIPEEKKHARWIRQLASIKVIDPKE